MMPDSNRTPADMMRLLVSGSKLQGLTEDEFVAQFNPKYAELARTIYRDTKLQTGRPKKPEVR